MTLTLLGTNHADPQGAKRMITAFNSIQPDWITIELVPGNTTICPIEDLVMLNYLLVNSPVPISTKKAEDIVTILQKRGFEERIAKSYAERFNTPYAQVDTENFDAVNDEVIYRNEERLKDVERRAKENAEKNLDVFLALNALGITGAALRFICAGLTLPSIDAYEDQPEIKKSYVTRDAHMAPQIREMFKQHGPNGLHVGGHAHMFGNYGEFPNLYQRLADLNPTRVKLCEFD